MFPYKKIKKKPFSIHHLYIKLPLSEDPLPQSQSIYLPHYAYLVYILRWIWIMIAGMVLIWDWGSVVVALHAYISLILHLSHCQNPSPHLFLQRQLGFNVYHSFKLCYFSYASLACLKVGSINLFEFKNQAISFLNSVSMTARHSRNCFPSM